VQALKVARDPDAVQPPEESTPPFEGLKAIENLEDYDVLLIND
jgi:hypothetical protein